MEGIDLKQVVYRTLIRCLNGGFISKLLKNFASSRFSKPLILPYAKFYKINMEESRQEMKQFHNLHAFFTRNIKADVRPIDLNINAVVSPVDAVLEDVGIIELNTQIQVKNKPYSIAEMLGDVQRAERYAGGTYLILYLSPSHYHRIHAPISGEVLNTYSLGGRSYPVNKLGLQYGDSPLAKNYRVVSEVLHGDGQMAMVKVGAMFINSVQLLNKKSNWKKGEEIAYFSFGSTVVLLFEKDTFKLLPSLTSGSEVKMGSKIGTLDI